MPCEAFEDLLNGYSELSAGERAAVEAHLAACLGCRAFLETLTAVDQGLTALYLGAEPRRIFDPTFIKQPSPLPEILDFIGWAAVAAIVIILSAAAAARFGYTLTLPPYAGWYAGATAAILFVALNRVLRTRSAH
jgi:anti-sigma factor RsiW